MKGPETPFQSKASAHYLESAHSVSSRNRYQGPNAGRVRIILIAALLTPFYSSAGQFYDEPSATLTFGYDDNVRFDEKNEDSTFKQKLSASTGFGYRTEISDIKVKVRADIDRYSEESSLNTDNQFLYLDGGYRVGLNLFRVNGQLVRDTSHTSELETTGLVQRAKRRYSGRFSPTWIRTLNERTSLNLGYTYNKVIYDDSSTTGLFDYRFHGVQGGVSYILDERTQLSAKATFTYYRVSATDSDADDVGIEFGVKRSLSETLEVDVAVGARSTNSKAPNARGKREEDRNNGMLLNASLKKRFLPTTDVTLKALRELRPTGSGRLLDVKMVGLDLRHELSERWTFTLGTSLFRNKTNNDNFAFDDEQRTYYSIEPRLRWRLTRWWDLTGSYRYRYQQYDGRDGNAASNAIFIQATYNWPRESVAKWSEL